MKVLSIAHSLLRHDSPHGGGQTYAYYMSKIAEDPSIELHVICMCSPMDKDKAEFDRFNSTGELLFTKGGVFRNVKRILLDLYGKAFRKTYIDSYFKHHEYINAVRRLRLKGYIPDVIILEWTQCVSLVEEIKSIFPNAKIVASEHDVMFLSYERKAELTKDNEAKHSQALTLARRVKKEEIEALTKCDVVMPHNLKDRDLLVQNGIPLQSIHPITAFFHDYCSVSRSEFGHDLLFWGAMSRPENYNAAIWFIKNVMPLISDLNTRFVVVGNRPDKSLLDEATDRVVITGFVEDPIPYFENSLCLCAPLLVGAGIKIKIMEALSAGIPVLTNEIGIEGIPAKDGIDYCHCKKPEDYEQIIRELVADREKCQLLSRNGRGVIKKHFNLERSASDYLEMLHSLT